MTIEADELERMREAEQEARRLFDLAHNNSGWKPIAESLLAAYAGGRASLIAELKKARAVATIHKAGWKEKGAHLQRAIAERDAACALLKEVMGTLPTWEHTRPIRARIAAFLEKRP